MCTRGWVPSPCGHFRLFAHQLNVPTCFDYKFGISKQLVSLASSFQTQGSSFTWSFLYHTSLVHTLNSAFCFSIWLALARNLMSKLHSLRTRCFLLPIASPLYVSLSLSLSVAYEVKNSLFPLDHCFANVFGAHFGNSGKMRCLLFDSHLGIQWPLQTETPGHQWYSHLYFYDDSAVPLFARAPCNPLPLGCWLLESFCACFVSL